MGRYGPDSLRLSVLLIELAMDGDLERVKRKVGWTDRDVAEFAGMAYRLIEEHVPGGCDGDTGLPSEFFRRRHRW